MINLGNKPKIFGCAGVIENHARVFPVSSAQAPADDLDVKAFRFRWPRQNDTANVPINAGRQASDVADNSDLSGVEFFADFCPLFAGRECIADFCPLFAGATYPVDMPTLSKRSARCLA